MLFNVNRDSEKSPDGVDWTSIFPEWKEASEEPEDQTEDEMFEVMKMFAAAHPEGLSH